MSNGAPTCPISSGQPIPGKEVFHRGEPWRRPRDIQDAIDQIPTAHDLRSAILALNRMNSIISMINRGEPMINNTRIPKEPDIKEKGEDHNPHYDPRDWVESGREYVQQEVVNPDDESQTIKIKTLKYVDFYNPNTDYRLTYYSYTGS
jgi:hypothetical protein